MGRVYKPSRVVDGVRITYPNWYIRWWETGTKDHKGRWRTKKVGPDKRMATEALAKFEERERRRRLGLLDAIDAEVANRARPVTDLVREYLAVLSGRDSTADYRALVGKYLSLMAEGCGWRTLGDLTADSLTVYLGVRREQHGNGPATLNSYLRVAKGFSRWAARKFKLDDALAGVKRYAEAVDRRRSKRIPTDQELADLIAAAERCPSRGRASFRGKDRAVLYRVAAYTGLRASELASLTPAHFALDATPPHVTVEARDAKARRTEHVPLPPFLVDLLRPWLAARPGRGRVWPGEWADQCKQRAWLERDLARAGVRELDDRGRKLTFHSLRRRFVVRLIEQKCDIHKVRLAARHKDVKTTLDYYTDAGLADAAEMISRLPPPPEPSAPPPRKAG